MSDVYENQFAQPVGMPVPHWAGCEPPSSSPMLGRFCRLERLCMETHAASLFQSYCVAADERNWTYLSAGPFATLQAYQRWLEETTQGDEPLFFAVIDGKTGRAVGVASYLRIFPNRGSMEVGHVHFSPLLQKSPAATEAMFLMMRRAFDEHGYRRYEWKCDALNAGSWRAAERLGFQLEGVFRQHLVYKGRSRDTAWFSMLDREWCLLKQGFQKWLSEDNFDEDGTQRTRLCDCLAGAVSAG